MIGNNEINSIHDYLRKKAQPIENDTAHRNTGVDIKTVTQAVPAVTVAAQSGTAGSLVQKSVQGFQSAEEKEKQEMSRWLEKALDSTNDFSSLVMELLQIKGYENDYPRFYNKAEIDRRLFSKIIAVNQSYHPDIKTAYKIIIGLELNIEQANKLLRAASYSFGGSLYSLIIQYCVENSIFEHKKIDEYLMEFCGETLYSIK